VLKSSCRLTSAARAPANSSKSGADYLLAPSATGTAEPDVPAQNFAQVGPTVACQAHSARLNDCVPALLVQRPTRIWVVQPGALLRRNTLHLAMLCSNFALSLRLDGERDGCQRSGARACSSPVFDKMAQRSLQFDIHLLCLICTVWAGWRIV